jgi:hypothetical protein
MDPLLIYIDNQENTQNISKNSNYFNFLTNCMMGKRGRK